MAEIVTDIGNDTLDYKDWDVKSLHFLYSKIIQDSELLPDEIPFESVLPTNVYIPPKPKGKVDGYIDDLIPVVLHHNDSAKRVVKQIPLAMHILGHPVNTSEPLPQDNLLSFQKLIGEGRR